MQCYLVCLRHAIKNSLAFYWSGVERVGTLPKLEGRTMHKDTPTCAMDTQIGLPCRPYLWWDLGAALQGLSLMQFGWSGLDDFRPGLENVSTGGTCSNTYQCNYGAIERSAVSYVIPFYSSSAFRKQCAGSTIQSVSKRTHAFPLESMRIMLWLLSGVPGSLAKGMV